ncbi:transcriptional regulator with XRE-family HTH domain [Kitasatospora sp. MAA4]|uniref:helix-turn-helix domain-containing protein n=1 Tax=Kitasatospora sp. MAA4 TaxID=3035093 RepID=UPI002476B9E9|nr:helix-turn-helix domain-containing protein [Kitasatospora sp. MAA4]MDH6133325.1 transcriptional regulator with XRE-family HTH domain [Kitasatospora sp. MAA4]
MGRQEQPLDAGAGPLAVFALDLRELRRQAGSPPYRQLAARINYSASTLAEACAGRRLPSEAVLAAFVTACGGDAVEWERRRVRTHRLITRPLVTVAEVVAEASPVLDASPAPPQVRRRVLGPLLAVLSALTFSACVPGDSAASGASGASGATGATGALATATARWLRPGTDIPAQYLGLIIEAGTGCPEPEITPALIAAMLKAESGFDPNLSDPAKDEYGIARWTPRVLRYYLPSDRQGTVPVPPFTAEDSILAVGRMLCAIAPELQGVPGDPALNLAAAYRTATWVVQSRDQARLAAIQPYLDQVGGNLLHYRPAQPIAQVTAGPGTPG